MDMEQNYVTVILCMARSGSDGRREDERGEKGQEGGIRPGGHFVGEVASRTQQSTSQQAVEVMVATDRTVASTHMFSSW